MRTPSRACLLRDEAALRAPSLSFSLVCARAHAVARAMGQRQPCSVATIRAGANGVPQTSKACGWRIPATDDPEQQEIRVVQFRGLSPWSRRPEPQRAPPPGRVKSASRHCVMPIGHPGPGPAPSSFAAAHRVGGSGVPGQVNNAEASIRSVLSITRMPGAPRLPAGNPPAHSPRRISRLPVLGQQTPSQTARVPRRGGFSQVRVPVRR